MKCPYCGGPVIEENNNYRCQSCNSIFSINENKNSDFVIRNGVVEKYIGRDNTVFIPSGITSIGPNAFNNNLTINRVVFSDSVVSIEKGAFQNCKNLNKISNYKNINYFNDECFQFSGLEDLEIGRNVDLIGRNAFADIANLVSLDYHPDKNLSLDKPFVRCPNLSEVQMDQNYFFPFFCRKIEVRNNPNNDRPTYTDAFAGTKFIKTMKEKVEQSYKNSVCPDCGGHIKKSLLHAKCEKCGIDYKAVIF